MSIFLVNGPAGCGKSSFIYEKLLRAAEQDERTSYIFVVPEQFALTTEKELVEKSSGSGIMNIEVLSFTRLAYRIMEEAGDNGYPVLNDMGKTMLIRKVMQEQKNNLRLYAGKERSAGFLDEIKSMISELSQYLITPEALLKAADTDKKDVLSIKLADISCIYEGFRKKLEGTYTTAETMMELCYRHISGSKVLKNAVLVFDVFTGFTPSQLAFIEHLMSGVKDIYLCTTIDKHLITETGQGDDSVVKVDSDNSGFFKLSSDMVLSIISLGEKNGLKAKILDYEEYDYLSDEISFIRDNIFRYPINIYKGQSKTVITSHGNKKQEVYYIASKISELLRNENLRYDEIAVITGDLPGYSLLFEKIFKEYGIPCYIDETRDISSNPLISLITSLLNAAEWDFKINDVLSIVKSPLMGFDAAEINRFENYLLCYGYRGRSQYSKPWTAEKKFRRKVDLEEINRLRTEILNCIYELPKSTGEIKVHNIIVALYKILSSRNVEEKLLKATETFSEIIPEKADAYIREYEKIYDTVINLFQQIDDLMGEDFCTYKEFSDIFMTGVRKTKLGLLPPNKDVVTVGDVWRTRIKGIKILFFAGVNEGVVPRANDEGGILTDEERTILGAKDFNLAPGTKEKPLSEEFYIYLALSKPQHRLYISYPVTTDGGTEIKPSYIINTISRLLGVNVIDYKPGDNISELIGSDNGLAYVINQLSEGKKPEDDRLLEALLSLYRENSLPEGDIVEKISGDYAVRGSDTVLSEDIADKLYNHILLSSVSRLETFSCCAYKHFLRYGLGLENRPENEPDRIDYGNLFHDALSRFGNFVKKSGNDWSLLSEEICEREALNCFAESVENYNDGLYKNTSANRHLTERMKKVIVTTVKAVVKQIQAGDYMPESFEYAFRIPGRYMNLTGKIDRVDVCRENGNTWLKIVDYKTGEMKLDFVKLYHGLQLQLMVYMNSIISSGQFENPHPGAVFYQTVMDPAIESGKDVAKEKLKALRPAGVLSSSVSGVTLLDNQFKLDEEMLLPGYSSLVIRAKTDKNGVLSGNTVSNRLSGDSEINAFMTHAGKMTADLSKQIIKGKISITPYKYEGESPCTYCEYIGVCGFDRKNKRYKYNHINMEQDEAISLMVDEACQR